MFASGSWEHPRIAGEGRGKTSGGHSEKVQDSLPGHCYWLPSHRQASLGSDRQGQDNQTVPYHLNLTSMRDSNFLPLPLTFLIP